MPRRHEYSQHFLRSPRLVAELVGHSSIRRSDTVYDLGAGSGVISSVLARRAGHVIAVESEPRAIETLRRNLASQPQVDIVRADILRLNFPDQAYKIFANIPFHLSSDIVRYLVTRPTPPVVIYLIVQKQFAYKLRADDKGFTGQLGTLLAPWYTVRIRKHLRRTDFTPPPAVDTVFIELLPRDEPLLPFDQFAAFDQFTSRCYADQKFFAKLTQSDTPPSRTSVRRFAELFRLQK